jgi:hypothetical protein
MEINDFLGIAIVGSALSVVIEWLTTKYGTNTPASKAIAILLSIVVGGLYWLLSGTAIWQSVLGVLATSSTVFALYFNGKR